MSVIGLLEGIGILLLIPLIGMTGVVDFDNETIPFSSLFGFLENIPPTMGLPLILGFFILLVITQHILNRYHD